MKVTQIKDLLNDTMKEVLGEETVVQDDLSNVVDLGKEVVDTDNLDNYVKKLVNHIGKVIFTNRLYKGGVPSVLMDKWEFGSILEKISADMPDAEESDSWKLTDGQSYDQDIFYQPSVSAKFFNSSVTFEIPLSFTEKQVKESFSDVTQLNGFLSMLQTAVQNSLTVKVESLIMKTMNNAIGETLNDAKTNTDSVKAVNLLDMYNKQVETGEAIKSVDKALINPAFMRYASYIIAMYKDRISKISTLFNVGKKSRFTPADNLHLVLLSDFAKASDVYLSSDVFHNENVELPAYETVPYWQGSGKGYAFNDVSKVMVKTSSGATVEQSGIVGVMFDTNAIGVSNLDQRVTTNYNAKAEFYTNFYKMDAGYYNDLNENFVVFYLALPATEPAGK